MSSSAARVRAYRERQKAKGEPDSSQRYHKEHTKLARRVAQWQMKPFVGCDGEGAGVDDKGRQLYQLFRMGDRELFTGQRLTTQELLAFICDEPADNILVGFSFGYDVTMILRDLSPQQQARLFVPKSFDKGYSRFVWYKEYDIEYLPKNYFRVRRVKISRDASGKEIRVAIKGSVRTIYETFGFFQKSFVAAIKSFGCGSPSQIVSIEANKARRSDFVSITQEERDYCALECQLLAELMEKLREYCYAANIRPRTWNGAGKLASALHGLHDTMSSAAVRGIVPKEVQDFANMAYYGGRFEITSTGLIGSKVYEYDIRSAYPDAMHRLPCLECGTWQNSDSQAIQDIGIYSVQFDHSDKCAPGTLYGLPFRSRQGYLYWPKQGAGIYWGYELNAAALLGARIQIKQGYVYITDCKHVPFSWVKELYDYRRSIGSSGPGYPIKLGINSLYGKLAQRKGNGRYTNMLYAGMITAMTRAKLMTACAKAPGKIAMVATDGIYSLNPLDLDIGDELGQWEHETLEDLFIVQPGLYWSPDRRKRKSRGLPGKFFEADGMTQGFEQCWQEWLKTGGDFPSVSVPITNFIGLKLALARNKPELAGTWNAETRDISFDYRNKRESHIIDADCIVTAPKPGGARIVSLPHKDFLASGGHEPWENARMAFDEMPDYVDLSPPFTE